MITVFLAESGQTIQILKPLKSLEEVSKEIDFYVAIPFQILLTENGAQYLGPSISTSTGLNNDGGVVFVFNRSVLENATTSNQTAHSIDIEPPVPLSTVTNALPALGDGQSGSVTDRLNSYLYAFNSHVEYGNALLNIAKKHLQTCEILYQEQQIQKNALDIATQNLDSHARAMFDTFTIFNTHAQKEFTKHSSLLHNCPTDLTTLSQIPIHPAITRVAEPHKLDEYVPKDKLYAWVNRCQESHDHLIQKTGQLLESIQEIRLGCNIEQLRMTGVEFPKLLNLLESARDVVGKIDSIQTSFTRDKSRVHSSYQDILTSSMEPENRLQAIEGLYQIHTQEYIPEMTKYDRYVRETVLYFSDSKLHLTQVLQAKLQTISHFQSLIAAVSPTISNLTNSLNMQSEALMQLLHVHRMAPAWGATLVEIVRRKEYVRIFLQKAKEIADILNQFRTQEQRRRDMFKMEILRYIPVGLIEGLEDSPPYCEISVSNTKDALPNLSPNDIQGILPSATYNVAFEKMISSIKPSHISGDPSVASDSISKLQATMLKMLPQLENIGMDFEKIVAKSGFYASSRKLEEENRKLKQQLSMKSTTTSDHLIPSHPLQQQPDSSLYPKQEEMIKVYETRIKSLERVLQELYHAPPISGDSSSEDVKQLRLALAEEQKRSEAQNERLKSLQMENLEIRGKLDSALESARKVDLNFKEEMKEKDALAAKVADYEKDSAKQKQLLVEVSAHLQSCLTSLKSSEESIVQFDSIVIPNSVHADNLRQMMRKVEDDIISQMALLANFKSLNDSVGINSDDVSHELVGLLQRISDLELLLKDSEAELTQVQAREAVVEAECISVKKILSKNTEFLEQHQTSLRTMTDALEKKKEDCFQLEKINEDNVSIIRGLEERILHQSRKQVPDQGGIQQLLQFKESQLRVCREALEDWAIVSKLSLDFMSKCYTDFAQIQALLGMSQSPDISCRDILAFEIESLPEELDQFLPVATVLIKQTYEKVVAMAVMSSSTISSELKSQFKMIKFELTKRVTFQRFQVSSLCLFLPTKNPIAWAAFHVDSPHYFLAQDSHSGFDARIKKREWILGTITDITSHTAGQDGDTNRFGLVIGSVYHLCSAVPFQ